MSEYKFKVWKRNIGKQAIIIIIKTDTSDYKRQKVYENRIHSNCQVMELDGDYGEIYNYTVDLAIKKRCSFFIISDENVIPKTDWIEKINKKGIETAYVTSDSDRMLFSVFDVKKVRKFGLFKGVGVRNFYDWIKNKAISEGYGHSIMSNDNIDDWLDFNNKNFPIIKKK